MIEIELRRGAEAHRPCRRRARSSYGGPPSSPPPRRVVAASRWPLPAQAPRPAPRAQPAVTSAANMGNTDFGWLPGRRIKKKKSNFNVDVGHKDDSEVFGSRNFNDRRLPGRRMLKFKKKKSALPEANRIQYSPCSAATTAAASLRAAAAQFAASLGAGAGAAGRRQPRAVPPCAGDRTRPAAAAVPPPSGFFHTSDFRAAPGLKDLANTGTSTISGQSPTPDILPDISNLQTQS